MRLRLHPLVTVALWAASLLSGVWVTSAWEAGPVRDMDLEYRPRVRLPVGDTVPAFPDCQGHGCLALNVCRDSVLYGSWELKIWKVTSMSALASSDGSLSAILVDSVSDTAFDLVTFDTSGVAHDGVTGGADLLRDCVYIAGQTAPGGGYAIRNDSVQTGGVLRTGDGDTHDPANDVVFRYFHHWKDPPINSRGGGSQQANFSVYNSQRNVYDHMSFVGTEDQVFNWTSGRGGFQDGVTVTNSIIASGWQGGLAAFIQAGVGATDGDLRNIDAHRNLYPYPEYRAPAAVSHVASKQTEVDTIHSVTFSRNVIYHWNSRGMIFKAFADSLAMINNYYKAFGTSSWDDIIEFDGEFETNMDTVPWGFYLAGNVHTGGACTGSNDLWDECVEIGANGPNIGNDSIGHVRGARPPAPYYDYDDETAEEAFTRMVTNFRVGVDSLLNCDGTWRGGMNRMDSLWIIDVRDSTEVMDLVANSAHNTEMMPELAAGAGCVDTDADGLPDEWEARFFADSVAGAPAVDTDGDVWMNAEEYVNGSDPTVFTNADGSEGAGAFTPTVFPNSDSSINVYSLYLFTDTFIAGGGADTFIFRRSSTDTLPFGTIFDLHPDCVAGDTLALISTQDSLLAGVLTPLDTAAITTFGTTHSLPTCNADNVVERKVLGVAWMKGYRPRVPVESFAWRREAA